ncbi:MAG: hypothetical protein ACR2M1_10480 [Gemmatimonadaceae bacterium]
MRTLPAPVVRDTRIRIRFVQRGTGRTRFGAGLPVADRFRVIAALGAGARQSAVIAQQGFSLPSLPGVPHSWVIS